MVNICEIFLSLQGETSTAGFPTVFVRCAGCNLSCSYCDTAYAQEPEGKKYSIDSVISEIASFGIKRVTITGGEPLLQDEVPELCACLIKKGYDVQVETNGSLDISAVPEGARTIMDVKTPGSGMSKQTDLCNLDKLREQDEVKFVITSREDYSWSLNLINSKEIAANTILFSPAKGFIQPKKVAEWILEDRLESVRFQIQLHSVLWPGERER